MNHSGRFAVLPKLLAASAGLLLFAPAGEAGYQNFRVAVYARAYEVQQMKDPAWLESRWATISSGLHVDKIYLETHGDGVIPDQQTLDAVKQFFKTKGVVPQPDRPVRLRERQIHRREFCGSGRQYGLSQGSGR